MKVQYSNRRRAISGILAGIIFFAMLFTAGLSFITYTINSNNTYDRVQVANEQSMLNRQSEALSMQSVTSSSSQIMLQVINDGGVSVTIVDEYLRDNQGNTIATACSPQSGPINCNSPIPNPPSPLNPILFNPFTLAVGQIMPAYPTPFPALNNICTTTAPCTVSLVSQRGNVFSTSFPFVSPYCLYPSNVAACPPAPPALTSLGFGFVTFDFDFLGAYGALATSCTGINGPSSGGCQVTFPSAPPGSPGCTPAPCPNPGNFPPGKQPAPNVYTGYTVSGTTFGVQKFGTYYLIYALVLANADPSDRYMTLYPSITQAKNLIATGSSFIQLSSPAAGVGGGTAAGDYFDLGGICGITMPAPCVQTTNLLTSACRSLSPCMYGQTLAPQPITLPPITATCQTSTGAISPIPPSLPLSPTTSCATNTYMGTSYPVLVQAPNYVILFFFNAASYGSGIPTTFTGQPNGLQIFSNYLFLTGGLCYTLNLQGNCPASPQSYNFALPFGQTLPYTSTVYTP